MESYIEKDLATGVRAVYVPKGQFKTSEISVSLLTALENEETAAANALVAMLLCRSSAKYKTLTELNRYLAGLYGAELSPSIQKQGENQLLKFSITCVDDRFSLDGGSILADSLNLISELIFEPDFENGVFKESNVEGEKRLLIEKIKGEENEKRVYVLRRLQEIMFDGEPYSLSQYGTVEAVKSLTAERLTKAWKNLLKSANVLITVVGNSFNEGAICAMAEKFEATGRECKEPKKAVFVPKASDVKDVTERIDVKQGKLIMGFRVNAEPGDGKNGAIRSFCDVFGGGPYSKLFANVREKMSLCYYCSARYVRQKSYVYITSGCEEENMDKAIKEIFNQLEEIKAGNFDYEFKSSKIALTDALNAVNDAPDSLENWYVNQITDEKFVSPEESAAQNEAVTKDEIVKCADLLTLDTVFRLVAKEGE